MEAYILHISLCKCNYNLHLLRDYIGTMLGEERKAISNKQKDCKTRVYPIDVIVSVCDSEMIYFRFLLTVPNTEDCSVMICSSAQRQLAGV